MYCEKCCMLVNDGPKCPVCGSRRVRAPRREDGCFLCELQAMWGGMLADVLNQEHIPHYYEKTKNIAVRVIFGGQMECDRFYVPYERLEEAREIMEGLFPEEPVE